MKITVLKLSNKLFKQDKIQLAVNSALLQLNLFSTIIYRTPSKSISAILAVD